MSASNIRSLRLKRDAIGHSIVAFVIGGDDAIDVIMPSFEITTSIQ